MIRRRHGGRWLLITQADHAALSGQLAEHVSGVRFTPLDRRTILACGMHDAGWPSHDDAPTLNSARLPLDVFETPRKIALPIWSAAAQRAAEADPYAGLLVSLHSLALSAMPEPAALPRPFESSQMKERFETNKFQHKQIEEQEHFRRGLDMRTDIPLSLGLAAPGIDPREDQLLFDFRWLQALDQISLAICCTELPFAHAAVHPRPGQRPITLRFSRTGDDLSICPWPFNVPELSCTIKGRALAAGPWRSAGDFQETYSTAPIEQIKIRMKDDG